jgi:glutathione S-transferase
MQPCRLITIPFSHYCEKARWALDYAGIPYEEDKHLPVFHLLAVKGVGGRREVPVVVTPTGVVEDSTAILHWIDGQLPADRRLFPAPISASAEATPGDPADLAVGAEVARWEDRFDEVVGPHVRRWAYGHLLPDRPRAVRLITRQVPGWQATALRIAWPMVTGAMARGMKITPESVARSLAKVEAVFGEVDALLADGRPYLVGDRFTAADLTFAALAAPAVLPDGYARWLGGLDEAPPSMLPKIDEFRASRAGRHVLAMYTAHRGLA